MKQRGFTLIETLIVMAVFVFFMGMVIINILNLEPQISLTTSTSTIIADIRKQQFKTLTGNTSNNQISDFGIHLDSDKYTLFSGNIYTQGVPENSIITLPDNISIPEITFQESNIIFVKQTGEINDFVNGSNTFRVKNSITNEEKTITLNKLGVVTGVQ